MTAKEKLLGRMLLALNCPTFLKPKPVAVIEKGELVISTRNSHSDFEKQPFRSFSNNVR